VYGWEGGRIFTPDEPAAAARAGIVLPDGAGAYVAGLDGRARPYDLEDGSVGPPLPPVADDLVPFNAGILAASADSSRLAHVVPDLAAAGHLLAVYDTATGVMRAGPIGVGGYVESMVLSPDGGTVFVSMLDDGSVQVYDVATGARRGTIAYPGPADRLDWQFGVGLAPLGSDAVVIGSAIGIVRVVDVTSLAVTSMITTIRDASHALRSAGDGSSVVGAGPGGIALLDTATASVQWSVEEPENCWHLAVVAPADALYCGDHYGRIDVRDLTTGTVRSTLNGQNGNTGSLWAASDGTELVSFANNEAVVSRWRLDGTGPVTSVVAHGSTTSYISPDGEVVVAKLPAFDGRRLHLALDYAARLVDLDDGRDVVSLAELFVPTWAPDGDLVGIAVDEDGGTRFARCELDTRRLRVDGDLLAGEVDNLPSVDPGKARTLYPYDGPEPGQALLRAVDVATNRHVGPSIEVDGYTSSTISRSGHRVVAATLDGIVVFDGDTGERVGEIPGNDLRIAFVTVTDQLFVGSLSGELVQYDLETLEQIRSFGGSRGAVQEVFGTADGRTIVVRGGDGLISLFDVETGIRLGQAFTTTPDDLLNASLSLDGRTMTYGGGMRAPIRVVDLDPASWSAAACRIAGRNLTRDEWATHLGDLAAYRATCPEFPVPGG
jgi:WD40 repeat protein